MLNIFTFWILWTLAAWFIARWLGRLIGKRRYRWLSFPLLLILPLSDAPIAIPLAKRIDAEQGGVRIYRKVEAHGFLLDEHRPREVPDPSPSLGYLQGPGRYDYVEIRLTPDPSPVVEVLGPPRSDDAPPGSQPMREWYVQFRNSDVRPYLAPGAHFARCPTDGVNAETSLYLDSSFKCFVVTRTERPVSAYIWEPHSGDQSVGSLGDRLNIRKECSYVRELASGKVLASDCAVWYRSGLGSLFGSLGALLSPYWKSSHPNSWLLAEAIAVPRTS